MRAVHEKLNVGLIVTRAGGDGGAGIASFPGLPATCVAYGDS